MILASLVYLMLDTIGNTFLFSINPNHKSFAICYMGVMITVICQFGFLAMVFMRMYRVYAVFSAFAKVNPVPIGNPFLKESEHFHYYNIEHHSSTGEDNHH